jgi:Flp pilus assembly pilin Flp
LKEIMPLTPERSCRFAAKAIATLRTFLRDDGGQDLIEYAYLAAFIGTTGYLALTGIVPAVSATYSSWINPNTGTPKLWEPAPPWTSSGS